MEKIIKVNTRINGVNSELFVTEELKLGISKGDLTFICNTVSPFQFAAFSLSSIAGQLKRDDKLEDKRISILKNNDSLNAEGHVVIYIGKRSDDIETFNIHLNSAKIVCNAINPNDPEENLYINFRLSAINTFAFLGKLESIEIPLPYYLLSELKLVNKEEYISIKVGGGQPAVLKKENISILLFALERWLSGQAVIDRTLIRKYNETPEEQRPQNRPYYTTRFNRDNILFDGRIEGRNSPLIVVNGLRCKLTYFEIAELYYVLKNMAGI